MIRLGKRVGAREIVINESHLRDAAGEEMMKRARQHGVR